jgi:uncharacterized membrane protein YhaH (DUF805 family)
MVGAREKPMLEAVFSFRGRINRLQYFLSCVAFGMALIVFAVLAVGLVAAHGGLQGAITATPGLALIGLLAVLLAPVFLWVSYSLQARRFRDIGWEPLYVIPGWIAIDIVDRLLAKGLPSLAIGSSHDVTPIGGLVNLALVCALLFWPGAANGEFNPSVGIDWPEPEEPSRAAPVAPVRAAVPARSPAPVRAAASVVPAAPSFGRRGL